MERIVLAYSGGLETSVAIPWLREHEQAEIVAVTMDLGQGGELEDVRDRALAAGAARAHVLDLREEFAHRYILPALKADVMAAMDDARFPMAAALARPLIAEKLVEMAGLERATAVAHGSTAYGTTATGATSLDVAIRTLNPTLRIVAPPRGIVLPPAVEGRYRVGTNLWGRSIECVLGDELPGDAVEDLYQLTKSPAECPDEPAFVEISFERGVPTAINGVAMPMLDLVAILSTIAGAHGVGRLDQVGPRRTAGPRVFHESPAAVVLHAAHKELQQLVTPANLARFAQTVSHEYAGLVQDGLWFTPLRESLDAFVDNVQQRVTGSIRLKLFKGQCLIELNGSKAEERQVAGAGARRT